MTDVSSLPNSNSIQSEGTDSDSSRSMSHGPLVPRSLTSNNPLRNLPKPQDLGSRSSRPAPSLPTLRLMLFPTPGLAFDARLPFSKPFRCYLSLDSYFRGTSEIRIGVESNHFPFIRLELTPSTTLSVRIAAIRLSDLKFGVFGASFRAYNAGHLPTGDISSLRMLWHSLQSFVRPVVEVNHRNTLLGALVEPRQRQMVHDAIADFRQQREQFPEQLRSSREALVKMLQQRGVPPVDPRQRSDGYKSTRERMKKQIERLGDLSSIHKPGRSFWPEDSLLDPKDDANVGAQIRAGDKRIDETGPAILGHVEEGKDGRLSLKRWDGSDTSWLDNAVLNEMDDRGWLSRLKHRVMTTFFKPNK